MFTGIIAAVGQVVAIEPTADPIYTIATDLPLEDMKLGASIACNGVCLTAIEIVPPQFKVQASAETLALTTASTWHAGTWINLERPLRAGDEFGGHVVSGHVDGVAQILAIEPEGDSLRFTFEAPRALRKFIAAKGSVTLDGVSLTVNKVSEDSFTVNIIPHTQQQTNLCHLQVGDRVNCEIDTMARYLDNLLTQRGL